MGETAQDLRARYGIEGDGQHDDGPGIARLLADGYRLDVLGPGDFAVSAPVQMP